MKGNGLRYKLILRCDPGWDSVGYTAMFNTTPAGWQTVRIPFSEFVPVFRARTQRGMPPLNAANVCSMQLMFRWGVGRQGEGLVPEPGWPGHTGYTRAERRSARCRQRR